MKQAKYFLFILNTGIRRGEACALKYSDIDFEKRTAAIQRNITTAKKRDKTGRATGGIYSVEGTPKTKGS
ncbi:MAG: tyrosine-type recombinase/integrase, partial [Clostridia bacterium]|nr:tyrosine-type recombinase/integrase [Clostridia bacterium]